MSYYERPSPEEYEDIIDDLEAVNEEHVEHIKNLKEDLRYLETENKQLKEELQRISFQRSIWLIILMM